MVSSSKLFTFILFLIFISSVVYSVSLHGMVYNADNMQLLNNSFITLGHGDGIIQQQVFSTGHYSLEVPNGEYKICAYYYKDGQLDSYAEYELSLSNVSENDSVYLDLLLIPYELQKITPGFKPPFFSSPPSNNSIVPSFNLTFIIISLLIVIIFVIVIFGVYHLFRSSSSKNNSKNKYAKNQKDAGDSHISLNKLDSDCSSIVEILKENEGRIEQKTLREILNFSESKMSLTLSELESYSIIKRIKRGRKNIIKLIVDK